MARCGCTESGCSCVVASGGGIEVEGSGTENNPYVISTTAATGAHMDVQDSDTIDITLSGTGSSTDPWVLTAEAIGDAIGTALQVEDTSTVTMSLSGTGATLDPYSLSASVIESAPAFEGRLIARRYYSSNATFNPAVYPAGRYLFVQLWGAGGGGGSAEDSPGTDDFYAGGSGGGGGAYAEKWLEMPAGSESITVGLGGNGGVSSDANSGEKGGNTSFGSLVDARGGSGGTAISATGTPTSFPRARSGGLGGFAFSTVSDGFGANGGDGGGFSIWEPAGNGADAIIDNPFGGSSPNGGGISNTNASGTFKRSSAGHFPGGGGSGCGYDVTTSEGQGYDGGNGADGLVIVSVYS